MFKLTLILAFVFLCPGFTYGQNTNEVWNPEKKTFSLYKERNWSELIFWGKKAINEGNDYFYLRMRLGIAFYERKNYHRALIHFKKAAEFNDKDSYLLEYLYFANLFSGREKAALDVTRKFPPTKTKKYITGRIPKFKIGGLGMQYYQGSLKTDVDLINSIDDPSLDGYQVFTNNSLKFHLGFNHLASRRFNLYYQYGLFIDNRFTYYQDNMNAYYFTSQKIYEHHLFMLGGIYLGKDFNLYGSVHYIPGKIPEYYSGAGFSTSYVPAYKYNDFTGSLFLSKEFPYITIDGSASFSYLNFGKYIQEGASITFFPLGNLNLYLKGGYYWQQEIFNAKMYKKGTHVEYKAGFRVFNPLWFEFGGSSGDLHYTVSQLGWQVFNGPNPSDILLTGSIIIPFNEDQTIFSLNYNYINSISSFVSDDPLQADLNSKTYYIYSIYGGLSWKF
ncbi:MAG: hypothetical protein U9N53_08790 [Bacteroidota bacterium]|nr:hypothetical protein [Bacteroidota bacterium]